MDQTESTWLPRGVRGALAESLADTPVVVLLGPRQSGKSSLVRRAFPDRNYLTFDDDDVRRVARRDPAGFVAGLGEAVTLDEVQRAPGILPALKMAVDHRRQAGRFLLTGSANLLLLPSVSESLAGRLALVPLHPLTESEKSRMPGGLLSALLEGALTPEVRPGHPDPRDLILRLLAGGFPEAIRRLKLARLRRWHQDYVRALIERDAHDVANLRTLDHLERLLALLAHQTAQLLTIETLARQLGIRRETVSNNLAALERLFLIRTLPAWHRNEARRLIKAPKVHLVDSGLAGTLLDLDPSEWNTRRDRFGHLVETFAVQQLIAQAGWTDPALRFWHYRDKDQVEVDLVITRGRRTWGVEVKAGVTLERDAGRGLSRLADQCGDDFQGGMILHSGLSILPTADPRVVSVPLSEFWTR